jgi:hypothetical protein
MRSSPNAIEGSALAKAKIYWPDFAGFILKKFLGYFYLILLI